MRILVAASECVPLAKTGGLADVVGAVPAAIAAQGHDTAVVMPLYRQVRDSGVPIAPTGKQLLVPVGAGTVVATVWETCLPDTDVPVYLIDQPDYFDRDELYQQDGQDYPDNCERFVFFARAVLEAARALKLKPDVIHANDWQTGLVPVYLQTFYRDDPTLSQTGTLFTIHNIAYQGHFWHWDMHLTGLDWRMFNWRELEFYGHLNLLKAGLVFADAINTVSPTYARQIQTREYGHGMQGVLRQRQGDLYGILNGVDYGVWSPDVDPLIPRKYTPKSFRKGKGACKRHLQKRSGLPEADVPLLAMITRLADQKGLDLVARVMPRLMEQDVQFVVLGTGEPKYHRLFGRWAKRYAGKLAAHLTFDNELAHQIEAGADLFLMPSRFEPCGLNQMYSLRYGTVPVVRATGGLADTIVEDPDLGQSNGFRFVEYDAVHLAEALDRALAAYADRPVWEKLVTGGMRQDWSWGRSAEAYLELYDRIVKRRRSRVN